MDRDFYIMHTPKKSSMATAKPICFVDGGQDAKQPRYARLH